VTAASADFPAPRLHKLGRVDYREAFRAMRTFTDARDATTPDEIWLLEHPPVYTMGLKGGAAVRPAIAGIEVVPTDRGGDLTYHGPGQLVAYLLLDLRRLGIGPKELVRRIEQAIIDVLAGYAVGATRRASAPGVYVGERKIASLGLRIRNNASYHGLALNVDMDLTPFTHIDPCGYHGLEVTQLRDLGIRPGMVAVTDALCGHLFRLLGYTAAREVPASPTHAP
jgi:lipoyl(octanoyl) transferase